MANIVCNPIIAQSLTGFPFASLGGCYVRNGSTGTVVQFFIELRQDGLTTVGSNLAPATPGNRGRWLAVGESPGDYELRMDSGDPPDGVSVGTWYPLTNGRLFVWSYTLAGASGGTFVSATLELRRISDGVVVGIAAVDGVQIGVNVECV